MRTVWYPGHMAKGKRQLSEILNKLDLIIEVRDARAPLLSSSPLIKEIVEIKPVVCVLSKIDIADDNVTKDWLNFFVYNDDRIKKYFAVDLLKRKGLKGVVNFIHNFKKRLNLKREIRLAVLGIPNVGKSLLINLLVGGSKTKVGAVAGLTKGVSWYKGRGLLVVDTPGILNPKDDKMVQRMLSWIGCVKYDVISTAETLACELLDHLLILGKLEFVIKKYKIKVEEKTPLSGFKLLQMIAFKVGALSSGGRVDLERAGAIVLNDFARGKIGKISIELPPALKR